ncbi:tetratricopeptide repeat protein [bacterium]
MDLINIIKKRTFTLMLILLILLPSIVFLNSLKNSFHSDDHYRIKNNPEIQRVMPIWRHFTDPRTMTTDPVILQFRPMLPLTLSLNYAIAKHSLIGYHLGNLLFHIISVLLIFFLILELLKFTSIFESNKEKKRLLAFAAASMFAIHPISGIPINYVCSRDLLLMYMFFMLSFFMYVRMRSTKDSIGKWIMILAALVLSLLSKQNAVVMPFIILLFELLLNKQDWRKKELWIHVIPFFIVAGMLYVYPKLFLNFTDFQSLPKGLDKYIGYPFTQVRVHLFTYLPKFLVPFKLRIHTDSYAQIRNLGLFDRKVFLGLIFIFSTLTAAWRLRKKNPLMSFSILAYWTFFIPSSSIIPLFYTRVDYRAYPSSPFLFLILAWLVFKYLKKKQMLITFICLISYFSFASIITNPIWKTEKSYYSYCIKHNGTAQEYLNLAMSVKDLNDRKKHLEQAIRIAPNYTLAYVNLGLTLMNMGRSNEAIVNFNKALKIDPNKAITHYWTAKGFAYLGKKEQALAGYIKAAVLDPRNLEFSYAAILETQKVRDFEKSIKFANNIIKVDPAYKNTLFLKAFALQKLGRLDESIEVYKSAIKKNPNYYQSHFNLAYAYMEKGENEMAIKHFERTLELNPKYDEVKIHLANIYKRMQK